MSPRALAEALAERLDALIHRPEQQRLALSQWRLVLDSGTSVEVGLKDNRPGGPYDAPKVRLPGAGGAPEIASQAKEVFIVLKQSPKAFVAKLPFVTSA